MDELSEVWYSGYHRRLITHSSCQLKAAIAITVLILCGISLVVIGVTADSLQMKTGGYTMCTFGVMAAICLFWWRYFKRRVHVSEGAMRINELQSSTTQSVQLIELILREQQSNNDESHNGNLSSSRREINFLLKRMIGHPPSYEEVTTNDDTIDTATQTQCVAPPCYTGENRRRIRIPLHHRMKVLLSERQTSKA